MAKTTAAPSTVAENPLADSMARVTGDTSLSAATGEPITYDPNASFRQPEADVINISGSQGTGATTAETWSHDIALENLKRQQLEFEYQQQQEALANALRQAEAQRAQQQLQMAQESAAREAGMYGLQQTAAGLANQQTLQQMALARSAEQRAADELLMKYGGWTPEKLQGLTQNIAAYNTFRGGIAQPVTGASSAAWQAAGYPGAVGHTTAPTIQGVQQAPVTPSYSSSGTPSYTTGYAWPSGKVGVGMPVAVGTNYK